MKIARSGLFLAALAATAPATSLAGDSPDERVAQAGSVGGSTAAADATGARSADAVANDPTRDPRSAPPSAQGDGDGTGRDGGAPATDGNELGWTGVPGQTGRYTNTSAAGNQQ